MTKQAIEEMLKDLVNEIDYDIYKEMFVHNECQETLARLIAIVEEHLP